jgi:carboxypeptidase Taq
MPENLGSSYKKLLDSNKELQVLYSLEQTLQWDMETMMPAKAVMLRSDQMGLLTKFHHKLATSPTTGRLLSAILKHPQYDTLSQVEKRNVYLIKKTYDEQTKLPSKLVTAIAKQQTISVNTWKKAKTAKDFAMFKPELEKLVSLNKQAAEILMKVKETKTPYDALLDIYEPKMTGEETAKVFTDLQVGLRAILSKIERSRPKREAKITETVPVEKQREIVKVLIQTLGYEVPPSPNASGRLDETEHPFTAGYYDDVRITTHYYPDNLTSAIFSVLHETGHAIYEQSLPQEWKYMPIGNAAGMGIHESQSRLFENIIGRSLEFWTNLLPKIKKVAAPSLQKLKLDDFIRAVNIVKPSKIRIEADEVTYGLHIVIRFELEKAIFANKVKINELPEAWNQKYKEILGVDIENDSEGVMQDTHWASGYYGYFPSYAMGNIYSGQILGALQKAEPHWRTELAEGNLANIRRWLTTNIYSQGSLYDPSDLIKKITGTSPTVKPYLKYLEGKFDKIYGV